MSQSRIVSPWTVVVTSPTGQEVANIKLRPGVPVTIGRAPDCNIMIGVMTVSRQHGRIELGTTPTYVNEPGAKGATVDGDPVDGSAVLGERTTLEIAGYCFQLRRERAAVAATPAAPKPQAQWTAPTPGDGGTLLDRHISGLRMYRNDNQREQDTRRQKWEGDWKQVVGQSREIQLRYGRHPSVMEFAVAKDESEVTIKLRDTSPRGYTYFILSRQHPEGRFPEQQTVWLREVGRGDESFSDPLRGFDELMSRIAPRLA